MTYKSLFRVTQIDNIMKYVKGKVEEEANVKQFLKIWFIIISNLIFTKFSVIKNEKNNVHEKIIQVGMESLVE